MVIFGELGANFSDDGGSSLGHGCNKSLHLSLAWQLLCCSSAADFVPPFAIFCLKMAQIFSISQKSAILGACKAGLIQL